MQLKNLQPESPRESSRQGSDLWEREMRDLCHAVLVLKRHDRDLVERLMRLSIDFLRRRNWRGFSSEDAGAMFRGAFAESLQEIKENNIASPELAADSLRRALERVKKQGQRYRERQDVVGEIPRALPSGDDTEERLCSSDFLKKVKTQLLRVLMSVFRLLSERDQAFIAEEWGLQPLLDPESKIKLISTLKPESRRRAVNRAKLRLQQAMIASLEASRASAPVKDLELIDAALSILDGGFLLALLDPNSNSAA